MNLLLLDQFSDPGGAQQNLLELLPALRSEPDATVVATGTSCRHQIRDLESRRALHPMELIAQACDAAR